MLRNCKYGCFRCSLDNLTTSCIFIGKQCSTSPGNDSPGLNTNVGERHTDGGSLATSSVLTGNLDSPCP